VTNVYERYVLPRLLDRAMQRKTDMAERARLVPRATGTVLEIGAGSGLNLPFYGAAVERLYAVDPSVEFWVMAKPRLAKVRFPVEFLPASAEQIPLRDSSVDTIVSTWTLCSVPDPDRALREMRRVMRPSGIFIFVEHGRAPDHRVEAWQNWLNPIWTRIAGGCNLNRSVDRLIERAGFQIIEIERGYKGSPRPLTFTYKGLAESAGTHQRC